MPISKYEHTVAGEDTAKSIGSGDLEVLATPRLISWCERASFRACANAVGADRTTVGTEVRFEHLRGTPVGGVVRVECAEPFNDGRRLVCSVTVVDAQGETVATGEFARAVVDPDRFMAKCQPQA